MKKLYLFALVSAMFVSCSSFNRDAFVREVVASVAEAAETPVDMALLEKGVSQVVALWREEDGSWDDCKAFCVERYIADPEARKTAFDKIERNMEILNGYANTMSLELLEPSHLDMGPMDWGDEVMGSYQVSSHFADDLFANKYAFYVALNFPAYTLAEKKAHAADWSRLEWAYARLGDMFTSRVPAAVAQKVNDAVTAGDNYIASYNIYMGNVLSDGPELRKLFSPDKVLITHWNLRDELKSNYADAVNGYEKQQLIYSIMNHIVLQDIPACVIDCDEYLWSPLYNKVYTIDGALTEVSFKPEPCTRYQYILDNFHAMSQLDAYDTVYPDCISRAFDGEKELSAEEVETLFINFISSPEIAAVGQLISSRLGRPLQPFDIWYNGFTPRSDANEDALNAITRRRFPNPAAFQANIPNVLTKLGWTPAKAQYIADKIKVDPARGAGHAWGAQRKGDYAHLRTRIAPTGMDYKGYNIAVHELGHNVEQTITLYDIDYYTLNGVPNTAFTEAVAFMFQGRDLELLGLPKGGNARENEALNALENCWSAYEIMGVSLVDLYMWRWMYANPKATAAQLRDATVAIAKDVWNKYYAPVFGIADSPILAVYSHMITSPLYLSNYPVGHLIDFQVQSYMKGKNFAKELTRCLLQGRVIPQAWMQGAVGSEISGEPTLAAVRDALEIVRCTTIHELSHEVRELITNWSYPREPQDDITYDDLRLLKVWYHNFQGKALCGELICNVAIADDLAYIFTELYRIGYPIQSIDLIDKYEGSDMESMKANNTSCFCYRKMVGSNKLSRHALGMAIDINPLYNPYVKVLKDGTVHIEPESAAQWADRSLPCPYFIKPGDALVALFTSRGFEWGGDWHSLKDYQHFEK